MSGFRLPSGGRIQRNSPVTFHFDGRSYRGYSGDTLASALLASGVMTVGRGLKFHRPRGLLSAGVEEPNALVEIGEGCAAEPSARATMVRLYEGLVARSQNSWPSRSLDLGRAFDWLHPLWTAGFYNKTFIWPSWRFWEPLIRHTAGIGRPLSGPDPDRYEHCNAHCDVLVVGGGPAGLAAALAAGSSGARVLLVEQDEEFGGSLLWERYTIDGAPAVGWYARILNELEKLPELQRLPATTAFGYYDHDVIALHQRLSVRHARETPRARYWRVRARQVILATGAIEQPLVFAHNDRPGIMLAGAVRHYLNRYAAAAGRRALLATNNDDAYRTALDLSDAGIDVEAVVDSRDHVEGELPAAVREHGIAVHTQCVVTASHGGRAITSATIGRLSTDRRRVESFGHIDCDVIAMSGGWQPAVHLYSQARGQLRFDESLGAFVPDGGHEALQAAGAASGELSLRASIAAGYTAGERAAMAAGFKSSGRLEAPRVEGAHLTNAAGSVRRSPYGPSRRQWVDFQHDVTVADLELAVRENYASVEHLKRYTTVGMSVDQGKTSNLNALCILAELRDRRLQELGTTTFRPPYTPVTLGAIAGRQVGGFYSPARRLPAHDWHRAHGALFEDTGGGWQRPICYPREGEDQATAIRREALAVRQGAGLFDSSPLGKIELSGPDAGEFLDRFYINNVRSLQVGRVRYGLMLNENGVIIDDGTIARLDDAHYVITTTSGNAARIAAWLEEWLQCEFTTMDVLIAPVTTQWATITLSGPRARAVLQSLETDIDLSSTAFPHMSLRTGRIEGVPARLYRVSFTGELAYEINVPAGYGAGLWERLIDGGANAEMTPYGIEAVLLLRMEKGYIHVGIDTDGTTTPDDIGWGHVAAAKRADFIGQRSLVRPENRREDRLQLVGLSCADSQPLVAGAHLRLSGTVLGTDGWITSAAFSPTLRKPIALAVLRGGRNRLGQRVAVHDGNRRGEAEVVSPVFYDPEGERLRD